MNRENVLKLMRKKDEIEREINQLGEVLESQGSVGMHIPLVDAEGYPRIDVDIYQVRFARQKIICLQNDHKAVMKEIEKCLHELHSQKNDDLNPSTSTDNDQDMFDLEESQKYKPIARVDKVMRNSPADLAGLKADDYITQFGSITSENYRSLQDISNVVQHSVGRSVPVTVRRNDMCIHLSLTPNTWSGRGLLGCNLLPV